MIRFFFLSFFMAFSTMCFAAQDVDISLLDDLQRENLLSAPPQTAFISTPRAAKSMVSPAPKKAAGRNKVTPPAGKKRSVTSRDKNTQLASLKKQNEALKIDTFTLRLQLERMKTKPCTKTPVDNSSEGLLNGSNLPSNDMRRIFTLNALKYEL